MASLRADGRARAPPPGAAGRRGRASLAAAALPVVLWHRVIADIAGEFRLDAQLPDHRLVAVGAHGARPAVLHPGGASRTGATPTGASTAPGTGAWMGWGITLYLLGFALATQVAQIADGLSAA